MFGLSLQIAPKKGLELLLTALSNLEQSFQLVVAGNGDPNYQASLIELSKELGIAEQCHFVGFVQGIQKKILLQGADLFVLTSYSENFGIAPLEALACATPVLLSNEVALSNSLKGHNVGFVCDLSNQSIQQSLTQALSDQSGLEELGRNARAFVEETFQWAGIAKRLTQLYQSTLSKKETPA